MSAKPTPAARLQLALASLLSTPAVRHLLNVVVTLLTGWLLLRYGGSMPASVPLPSAPVDAPPSSDDAEVGEAFDATTVAP